MLDKRRPPTDYEKLQFFQHCSKLSEEDRRLLETYSQKKKAEYNYRESSEKESDGHIKKNLVEAAARKKASAQFTLVEMASKVSPEIYNFIVKYYT